MSLGIALILPMAQHPHVHASRTCPHTFTSTLTSVLAHWVLLSASDFGFGFARAAAASRVSS